MTTRIYDRARGSGGNLGDINIYGQKSNAMTWRLMLDMALCSLLSPSPP